MQVMLPKGLMELDPSKDSSRDTATSDSQSSDPPSAPQVIDAGAVGLDSSTAETRSKDPAAADLPVATQRGEQHMPREQVAAGESQDASEQRAAYPPLARAKRLSYCMATALPDKFGDAEGRQVLSACSTFSNLFSQGCLPSDGSALPTCKVHYYKMF